MSWTVILVFKEFQNWKSPLCKKWYLAVRATTDPRFRRLLTLLSSADVRQLPNRHSSSQICFHVQRGLHVGASVSGKRLRKVRPQAAFVVKGRPFVAELIGTAYDPFGQFAEARRSASPVGSRALVQARNL